MTILSISVSNSQGPEFEYLLLPEIRGFSEIFRYDFHMLTSIDRYRSACDRPLFCSFFPYNLLIQVAMYRMRGLMAENCKTILSE